MAEFASKGVAGTGLGLGIAGTALSLLNNGNGGVLGGLLGGGSQNMVSALQAENSQLKAENYSDKNAKEVYMQSLTDNRRLRDETFTNVTNVITLNKDQVILSERDKLSCTITFNKIPSSGIITPARSYLRVDNHGSVLAKEPLISSLILLLT